MKRILLSSLLMLALFIQSGLAQDKTFPEGLRKITNKEMMDMANKPMPQISAYDKDGKLLAPEDMAKMMNSGKFMPEYYVDKEGNIAAMKLKELSEAQLAMMAEFAAEQARMEALIGTEAQDFEVTDMDGNAIKLSDLRGQVVAINFWFIGCKPCIMEMPELNKIVKEFEGKPVKFVAIALDKKTALEKFGEKKAFDYNIVPDGKDITKLYEISGYPTHCIIDQEGKIAYFKSAYSPMTATEITNTLEKLLH